MARNYRLPTIKELFAKASTCAYPDCQEALVFEDPARGVRVIAVQIAHIRSEKPNGPRYDSSFDQTLINESENLLLLCGKHHPAVDQNESVFTAEELLEWKAAQVATATGVTVSDSDVAVLMQSLQSSLAVLTELLEVRIDVRVRGGKVIGDGAIVMPLEALATTHIEGFDAPRLLAGVEVVNQSTAGVDVIAGLEFKFEDGSTTTRQLEGRYCPPRSPHRLDGRSTQNWFAEAATIHATSLELARRCGQIPLQIRAFAQLGDGTRDAGDWHDIVDLPVWKDGTTQDQIGVMMSAGMDLAPHRSEE